MKIHPMPLAALLLALSVAGLAQDTTTAPPPPPNSAPQTSPPRPGAWQGRGGGFRGGAGGRGLLGTVTEVAADHYTLKSDSGDVYTIHFSANTRFMHPSGDARPAGGEEGQRQQMQPIKPTDIKVGDAVTVAGEVDATAKSVGAVFIVQLDPERAKELRQMEANYGKTWLMGRVTAIDGVKVTLLGGLDKTAHSFVADENTTFRRHRDPITLSDVAVGDNVRIEGALKDGVFVATSVSVMGQPREQQGGPQDGPPGAPPK